VTTAIAAFVSAILSVVSIYQQDYGWWSAGFSIAAACAAVALNVLPFGTWEQRHRDLFRQWTDLREEADLLEMNLADSPPSEHHIDGLKRLAMKVHRINGSEPAANIKTLAECQHAEEKSRQERDKVAA
jgi:hypothetical protein